MFTVHGPLAGLRWTESTLLPFGLAYVHRVQAHAAGEGSPLLPSPTRCIDYINMFQEYTVHVATVGPMFQTVAELEKTQGGCACLVGA